MGLSGYAHSPNIPRNAALNTLAFRTVMKCWQRQRRSLELVGTSQKMIPLTSCGAVEGYWSLLVRAFG
jgi:hypothetical protein